MHHLHQENSHDSPPNRGKKADIAVKVQRVLRVVPPAHVENVIHQKSRNQFQNRSAEKSKQKKIEVIPFMPMGKENQKTGSHSIQGNPGSMAESSIL